MQRSTGMCESVRDDRCSRTGSENTYKLFKKVTTEKLEHILWDQLFVHFYELQNEHEGR